MRKILFIFIAGFYTINTCAQFIEPLDFKTDRFKVLDSAQLKFSYSFRYIKNDSLNAKPQFVVDKQSLLLGKNISKYYSQNYMDYSEKGTKHLSRTREEGNCSFEVFKNYPANKETVTEQAGKILGGSYIYQEKMNEFGWKIGNDTTTIAGYICQKATTTFRGRNYIAWFAPEIPSNNGPWKFGGLPGLILKIYDEKRNFTFECNEIIQLKKAEPIKFYTVNYNKTSRKEMDKLYRRFTNNCREFMLKCGFETSQTQFELPKLTYNPIELE